MYGVNGEIIYRKDTNLKICTYNVGNWYIGSGTNVPAEKDSEYYSLQRGMIADINADILCLNEYWTTFSKTGRTALSLLSQYYQYIETAGGSTQYMGRAICSKYPIISYTSHYFVTDSSRYYDVAEISIYGTTVYVIVTHLHPSNASYKIAQATELHEFITDQGYERYLICGDFNSTLYDPFSETNAAIYQQFINDGCALANDGAFGILNTACNSTDWANEAFAIDNIIISDAFSVESVNTDLTKTTDSIVDKIDHVPLYAIIEQVA